MEAIEKQKEKIEKTVTAVALVQQYCKDLVGLKLNDALVCDNCPDVAGDPRTGYIFCPMCGKKLKKGSAPAYLNEQPWYDLFTDLVDAQFTFANRKDRILLLTDRVSLTKKKHQSIDDLDDCDCAECSSIGCGGQPEQDA